MYDLVGISRGRTHKDSDIGIMWKRAAIVERGVVPEDPWMSPFEALVDVDALPQTSSYLDR
ncbi:hypothetical protein [Streptomyces sp. A5-4]|uniref:hypothetical protein n=1 Tax=Streptomyces sp. A5-4 TaxID=3384771 RepID=UPI003DAA2ED5